MDERQLEALRPAGGCVQSPPAVCTPSQRLCTAPPHCVHSPCRCVQSSIFFEVLLGIKPQVKSVREEHHPFKFVHNPEETVHKASEASLESRSRGWDIADEPTARFFVHSVACTCKKGAQMPTVQAPLPRPLLRDCTACRGHTLGR